MYCPGDCNFGLNAACGWLFVLVMVDVEPNEVEELPNEVTGDFPGDLGCPGILFCSFTMPFVGDRGLFTIALLCLSWPVLTVRFGGWAITGAPPWSNLFAMFLTDPAGLEGRR